MVVPNMAENVKIMTNGKPNFMSFPHLLPPPTKTPTLTTNNPTTDPSIYPTLYPTNIPTIYPSENPSFEPTMEPTLNSMANTETETETEQEGNSGFFNSLELWQWILIIMGAVLLCIVLCIGITIILCLKRK